MTEKENILINVVDSIIGNTNCIGIPSHDNDVVENVDAMCLLHNHLTNRLIGVYGNVRKKGSSSNRIGYKAFNYLVYSKNKLIKEIKEVK